MKFSFLYLVIFQIFRLCLLYESENTVLKKRNRYKSGNRLEQNGGNLHRLKSSERITNTDPRIYSLSRENSVNQLENMNFLQKSENNLNNINNAGYVKGTPGEGATSYEKINYRTISRNFEMKEDINNSIPNFLNIKEKIIEKDVNTNKNNGLYFSSNPVEMYASENYRKAVLVGSNVDSTDSNLFTSIDSDSVSVEKIRPDVKNLTDIVQNYTVVNRENRKKTNILNNQQNVTLNAGVSLERNDTLYQIDIEDSIIAEIMSELKQEFMLHKAYKFAKQFEKANRVIDVIVTSHDKAEMKEKSHSIDNSNIVDQQNKTVETEKLRIENISPVKLNDNKTIEDVKLNENKTIEDKKMNEYKTIENVKSNDNKTIEDLILKDNKTTASVTFKENKTSEDATSKEYKTNEDMIFNEIKTIKDVIMKENKTSEDGTLSLKFEESIVRLKDNHNINRTIDTVQEERKSFKDLEKPYKINPNNTDLTITQEKSFDNKFNNSFINEPISKQIEKINSEFLKNITEKSEELLKKFKIVNHIKMDDIIIKQSSNKMPIENISMIANQNKNSSSLNSTIKEEILPGIKKKIHNSQHNLTIDTNFLPFSVSEFNQNLLNKEKEQDNTTITWTLVKEKKVLNHTQTAYANIFPLNKTSYHSEGAKLTKSFLNKTFTDNPSSSLSNYLERIKILSNKIKLQKQALIKDNNTISRLQKFSSKLDRSHESEKGFNLTILPHVDLGSADNVSNNVNKDFGIDLDNNQNKAEQIRIDPIERKDDKLPDGTGIPDINNKVFKELNKLTKMKDKLVTKLDKISNLGNRNPSRNFNFGKVEIDDNSLISEFFQQM